MSSATNFDNRDVSEMYGYYEARIEALTKWVKSLEAENEKLTQQVEERDSVIEALRQILNVKAES